MYNGQWLWVGAATGARAGDIERMADLARTANSNKGYYLPILLPALRRPDILPGFGNYFDQIGVCE